MTDFGLVAAHAAAEELAVPTAALGVALFDRIILERFRKGWRPATFINDELMPFINA